MIFSASSDFEKSNTALVKKKTTQTPENPTEHSWL